MIYDFLEENWKIVKWVALGAVILEVSMQDILPLLGSLDIILFFGIELQMRKSEGNTLFHMFHPQACYISRLQSLMVVALPLRVDFQKRLRYLMLLPFGLKRLKTSVLFLLKINSVGVKSWFYELKFDMHYAACVCYLLSSDSLVFFLMYQPILLFI